MAPRILIALLLTISIYGQGTEPKAKPSDYPANAKAGFITVGAENWGHGLMAPGANVTLTDYIAIEVALYAEGNRHFNVTARSFTLYINGARVPLYPATAGMVAASVKYPDREHMRHIEADAGAGNAQVTLGQPSRTERFPGDPTARQPPVTRAPDPVDRSGVDRPPVLTLEQSLQRASLIEGEAHPPISGFLYFPFKDKLKKIKSLELRYEVRQEGSEWTAVLALP